MTLPHPHFAPVALIVALVALAAGVWSFRLVRATWRDEGFDAPAVHWVLSVGPLALSAVVATWALWRFFSAALAGFTKGLVLLAVAVVVVMWLRERPGYG